MTPPVSIRALVAFLFAATAHPTAVRAGDADQAFAEGVRHEHAEGVPLDYAKALSLYCTAAREGHSAAAYNIGWMYLNGRGIPRDDGQGVAWMRRAAALGHRHAPKLLLQLPDTTDVPEPSCRPRLADAEPPAPPQAIELIVRELAPGYGLDPDFVLAVIAVESGFRPDAVSPKNAQGLMQLIPDTARRFGVSDPFDPVENIRGGMRYLRWLLQTFDGDIPLALAGYNAGENAVERYAGVPPYPETLDYIEKVRRYYPRATHPIAHPPHDMARTGSDAHAARSGGG